MVMSGYDLQRKEEERRLQGEGGEDDLEEGWEYVEDGPAEIIWQGNEIIVKKPRKKVRKGTHSGTPLAIEVIILVCFGCFVFIRERLCRILIIQHMCST